MLCLFLKHKIEDSNSTLKRAVIAKGRATVSFSSVKHLVITKEVHFINFVYTKYYDSRGTFRSAHEYQAR